MKKDRRVAARKMLDYIEFHDLTSLSNYNVIAKSGYIIDASPSGFLIEVQRTDVVADELKKDLSGHALLGQQVALFLPQMNLDLDGTIARAKHVGKGTFEIAVEFSNDVPEYWRECLVDLLPSPGEIIDDEDTV